MNQFVKFDRRLSVPQQQLAQPIKTGQTEQKLLPVTLSLLRPRCLLVIALVAFLAGAPYVKKLLPPVSEVQPVTLVAESLPTSEIPNELAASMVPAAFTPTKLASRSEFKQIVIPTGSTQLAATHSLPAVQKPIDPLTEADSSTSGGQTTASSHPPADGESDQEAPKAAQPVVNKEAFFGEVFGVASITIFFDDERSPVVMPDQPIGVTDRDKRTSYAVATPSYRNKDKGDYHLTELTVQFLFRGRQPLDVSLQASSDTILLDEHIQVEDDQERRRQRLETWWASYSQPRDGDSGELDWIHRSVVEMLARRLELSLPNGWSKKLERRSMAKVEQDFERILSTLLGIDSMLIAMGQDSASINGSDVIADQPLPTAINIRPVATSSFTRETTVEAIAMRIPQECFYVRCGTLHNYEWLRSFIMNWNGSLEEIVKVAATDRSVRQRLEKQLALDLETCKRLGLEQEISDVALIGCDLNFDDGPAIGVVFEAKNEQAVQRIIDEQRKNILAKNPNAKETTILFRQRRVSIVHSPGYVIRSYSVSFGKYHLVTNSTFIVRRFFESSEGSRSLGRLDEFKLARQKVPSADSNVVQIYLSDPFFRQIVSPKFRIEGSRRESAAEDLKHLALTSALARAEGIDQSSVNDLKKLKYLPSQFNRRADNSAAQFVGSSVSDSVRGSWGTFKPIADMELDRATRDEVSEYQRFASRYARQWQRMDPVVANLSVTPNSIAGTENVKLDVLVVPFARQRYDIFNRYLARATSREIATFDDDLIAVTACLRSPQRGTMLARMGIHDESVEYRIENGQVVTTGKHRGITLAKSNLYVLIDSAGTAGLKRLGDFVQSLQGNSPVPTSGTTRRPPSHLLDLICAIPRLFGGIAKSGSIETQGNWTTMGPRKELRARVLEKAMVQSTTANAQVRFKMNDVNRSQAAKYINAYTYVESRKVSSANAALLNYVGHQLPLPVDEAPAIIEKVLGVKLVCPLGGEYLLVDRLGYRYWTASTDENESYFEISAVPEDYRFPFLNWLRGMELEFNLSGNTLTSNVRLTTKQSLPSHPNNANIRESRSRNPSDSSIARDDTTIGRGDAVLVTATTAQLKVQSDVLAELPNGQYLQVLKVQDDWIWTFVEQQGRRTYGWINIRQVAKSPE